MHRRAWILIGLVVLFSWTITAQPRDHKKEDCVEACVKKVGDSCYKKCDNELAACKKKAATKCKASKNADCLKEALEECRDEKEINCDPQCSIKVLQCVTECTK